MLRKFVAPILLSLITAGCVIVPAVTTITSSTTITTLPEPTDLHSLPNQTATSITFNNAVTIPLMVYWRDFDGKEVLYKTLEPGENYVQQTYATHAWVVREGNSNQPVSIVVAKNDPLDVTIAATSVTRTIQTTAR